MSDPVTFRVLRQNCPNCGAKMTGAGSVEKASPAPRPGDLTVCIECAAMLRFTRDMKIKALNIGEYRALKPVERDELLKVHRLVKQFHREKGQG